MEEGKTHSEAMLIAYDEIELIFGLSCLEKGSQILSVMELL